jgi:hypothetical protein
MPVVDAWIHPLDLVEIGLLAADDADADAEVEAPADTKALADAKTPA